VGEVISSKIQHLGLEQLAKHAVVHPLFASLVLGLPKHDKGVDYRHVDQPQEDSLVVFPEGHCQLQRVALQS